MEEWLRAACGGTLLGLGAAVLLLGSGRLAGVGGIVGRLLRPAPGDVSWRLVFVAGLMVGGVAGAALFPGAIALHVPASPLRLAAAGLLIGVGTRVGNGCTSGHGVCGVGRLSPRSFVATTTFTVAGVLAHLVDTHLVGTP